MTMTRFAPLPRNLVRSLGYVVHTFASAEDFLRSPHLNHTSCVITDVRMPAMSGLDLQAHLLAKGQTFPMIFVTAFSVEGDRDRALKAGATCFPEQTLRREALIESKPRWLGTARQRANEPIRRCASRLYAWMISPTSRQVEEKR